MSAKLPTRVWTVIGAADWALRTSECSKWQPFLAMHMRSAEVTLAGCNAVAVLGVVLGTRSNRHHLHFHSF